MTQWTAKQVEEKIRWAVKVERSLPKPGPVNPRDALCRLSVPEPCEDDDRVEARFQPCAQEVDEMVLVRDVWVHRLTDLFARDIVWLRCSGVGWKYLTYRLNTNKSTARRRWLESLDTLRHCVPCGVSTPEATRRYWHNCRE